MKTNELMKFPKIRAKLAEYWNNDKESGQFGSSTMSKNIGCGFSFADTEERHKFWYTLCHFEFEDCIAIYPEWFKAADDPKVRYYGWEGSRYGKDKPKTVPTSEVGAKTHYQGFKLFDSEEAATAHYKESRTLAEKTLTEHAETVRKHLETIQNMGIDFGIWFRAADDHGVDYGHMVSITINNFYFERSIS